MTLIERTLTWQAYIPQGGRVAGLIYQPFADWVGAEYAITAEVAPHLPLERAVTTATPRTPVIASVHSWIHWPGRTPPGRGEHLVLVTGAHGGFLRLHNPSGVPPAAQRDTLIPAAGFAGFYAERSLLIHDTLCPIFRIFRKAI